MTKIEAKVLALEMWEFLYENPNITTKNDLPHYILDKVNSTYRCALCDAHPKCPIHEGNDTSCPLFPCTSYDQVAEFKDKFVVKIGSYWNWYCSDMYNRKSRAKIVVDLIKAWEP